MGSYATHNLLELAKEDAFDLLEEVSAEARNFVAVELSPVRPQRIAIAFKLKSQRLKLPFTPDETSVSQVASLLWSRLS